MANRNLFLFTALALLFVATGFLRNTMVNEEGGVDPEQFRMESMFDRMDTIGKSVALMATW